MQVLNVGEILEGNRFQTPTVAGRYELEPGMPGLPRWKGSYNETDW